MGSSVALFLKRLAPACTVAVVEPDDVYEFASTLRASGRRPAPVLLPGEHRHVELQPRIHQRRARRGVEEGRLPVHSSADRRRCAQGQLRNPASAWRARRAARPARIAGALPLHAYRRSRCRRAFARRRLVRSAQPAAMASAAGALARRRISSRQGGRLRARQCLRTQGPPGERNRDCGGPFRQRRRRLVEGGLRDDRHAAADRAAAPLRALFRDAEPHRAPALCEGPGAPRVPARGRRLLRRPGEFRRAARLQFRRRPSITSKTRSGPPSPTAFPPSKPAAAGAPGRAFTSRTSSTATR